MARDEHGGRDRAKVPTHQASEDPVRLLRLAAARPRSVARASLAMAVAAAYRQVEFAEPGARPGGQQAQVVRIQRFPVRRRLSRTENRCVTAGYGIRSRQCRSRLVR
jgi:hypothetical protein